jgi:hypothetical protein
MNTHTLSKLNTVHRRETRYYAPRWTNHMVRMISIFCIIAISMVVGQATAQRCSSGIGTSLSVVDTSKYYFQARIDSNTRRDVYAIRLSFLAPYQPGYSFRNVSTATDWVVDYHERSEIAYRTKFGNPVGRAGGPLPKIDIGYFSLGAKVDSLKVEYLSIKDSLLCWDYIRVNVVPYPYALTPCANLGCKVHSLNMSTGYDASVGYALHAYTQQTTNMNIDPNWKLVSVPAISLVPAGSANVISRDQSSWMAPPHINYPPYTERCQWISPYPGYMCLENNPATDPNTGAHYDPYVLQYSFCTCQSPLQPIALRFQYSLNADDYARVLIDGVETFATTAVYGPWPIGDYHYRSVGVQVDQIISLVGQSHTIRLELRNLGSVSMGVMVDGSITAPGYPGNAFIAPECCDPTGMITVRKIHDANCDGQYNNQVDFYNTTEHGLANWTFSLVNNAGTPPFSAQVTTSVNGYATFQNIPVGSYTLAEIPQSPWTPSNPATGSIPDVTLSAHQAGYYDFFNCINSAQCNDQYESNLTGDPLNCVYPFTITNITSPPSPLSSMQITLTGGVFTSLSLPGYAYTTVPANIAGQSSAVITFTSPGMYQIQGSLGVMPTSMDGSVQALFSYTHSAGQQCTSQTTYHCCAPITCDRLDVTPIPDWQGSNKDFRMFTIENILPSPIASVDISFVPQLPGTVSCQNGIPTGGGLLVDNVSTGTFPSPYNTISCLPNAQETVKFYLGMSMSCAWTGKVRIITHHLDGSTCDLDYGPWTITPGNSAKILTDHPLGTTYGTSFQFKNIDPTTRIRYLTIVPLNPLPPFPFVIATSLPSNDVMSRKMPVAVQRVGGGGICFEFKPLVQPGEMTDTLYIFFHSDTAAARRPRVRVTSHDENGNAIRTDTTDVATPVQSLMGIPHPDEFEILSTFPNPSTGAITINYLLGRSMNVRLDVCSTNGTLVRTLYDGFGERGIRAVQCSTSNLAAGTYYVRMSSGDVIVNAPITVVK